MQIFAQIQYIFSYAFAKRDYHFLFPIFQKKIIRK